MADTNPVLNALSALARSVAAMAKSPAMQVLDDLKNLDADTKGRGFVLGLHVSIAASAGGTDVDFRTNPEFDLAIHSVRGAVEVGTAEATVNNGLASFNAAHCSVQLKDSDSTLKILDGTSPAAGGAGGVDMMLLGANGGAPVEFKVPFVFSAVKGARTLRATFATDGSWPGTRRAGIAMVCSYRRKTFRQAEAAV